MDFKEGPFDNLSDVWSVCIGSSVGFHEVAISFSVD